VAAVAVFATLVPPPPPAAAATYLVRPDGTGDFPNIQDAIDSAVAGDVIELADGVFTGEFNRDVTFRGKAVTVRSQSDDPEHCIIDCEGSELSPHTGFRLQSGETPSSIVRGVSIINGWRDEISCGGAIFCRSGANPTISNCIFADNEIGCGGGVWCQGSDPLIEDCVFDANHANHGGGGLFCTDSSPLVRDCIFLSNSSDEESGAVGCNFDAAPTFERCVFAGNTSPLASVIRCEDNSAPTFTDCTFSHNSGAPGSAVLLMQENATVTLTRCIIAFDVTAASFQCDGASTATLTCCDIYGNAGGDWVACVASQLGEDGNFEADPQFCATDPVADAYWAVQSDSPCLPGNHPGGSDCGPVGAFINPCGASAIGSTTWGAIKASFE
jgi:predicted outer membrane repeat protein